MFGKHVKVCHWPMHFTDEVMCHAHSQCVAQVSILAYV